MRKSAWSVAVTLALSQPAMAENEVHIVHCLMGCPSGAPASNDLIIRQIYALSSNDDRKFADWVAYKVTRDTMGSSKDLNRGWSADPFLDDRETLEPKDYNGAHAALDIDRGHQVPMAAFAGTVFWRDTNLLSNITPQKSDLNQGAWVALETAVRELTWRNGETWVVTGPLYDNPTTPLPNADEPHSVPSGYWKIVADGHGRLSTFVFDQDLPRDADYCDQRKTLEEIEQKSGLDLFPEAPGDWPRETLDDALSCEPGGHE